MDFFTVPTLTFGVLYCFVVIGHDRRTILHFNVTKHPTSMWIVQQLRQAFPFESAPRFLVFDRDAKYGFTVPMAGSCHRDQRATSETAFSRLRSLLSRRPNAFGTREGNAGRQDTVCGYWASPLLRTTRWVASSLRASCLTRPGFFTYILIYTHAQRTHVCVHSIGCI